MDAMKALMNKRCDVGGLHCPCCNDNRGHKNKARLVQEARRELKEETRLIVEDALDEIGYEGQLEYELQWATYEED